jgi:nucleoid-associated protein Lsr2
MSRQTKVVLIDDLDHSEPASTVRFSLNGLAFEIDLNAEHAKEFGEALAPWVARARRIDGPGLPRARIGGTGGHLDGADVRRWAADNGIPVRARGRLPRDLVLRYLEALGQ